jgi:hypothetical protein
MTVPLPIPDDPRIDALLKVWPQWEGVGVKRSVWLGRIEQVLRDRYPSASSDELTLTARNLAPFSLAKPGVP